MMFFIFRKELLLRKQGDQMSLWKTAQDVAQFIFLSKIIQNFYREKKKPMKFGYYYTLE
jgi:hypothetical protein